MPHLPSLRTRISLVALVVLLARSDGGNVLALGSASRNGRPNILFILTDDHRWDAVSSTGHEPAKTPNLDRILARGTRFTNAFVTLAICSPSRAACLTGQYGSVNGVTAFGNVALRDPVTTFAHALRRSGYRTGVTGKWHLKTSPKECGFDFASTCWGNGTWYDRRFTVSGQTTKIPGFVDDVTADESIRFMRESKDQGQPFMLWMCTQVPHMDHGHTWPAQETYRSQFDADEIPVPVTWNDDLAGKPDYLQGSRNRTQALKYGYDDPKNIQRHAADYYASVTQMDAAVGRVLDEIKSLEIEDNTWIIFMGDNGWLLGEHGMTSKVLPYEESMRVPMAIAGPSTASRIADDLVLNIDITATIFELAGVPAPKNLHGRSLLDIVAGHAPADWRQSFLYEAPTPQLGSQPLWAVRTDRWKYVETQTEGAPPFAELYDLRSDPIERSNLAASDKHSAITTQLRDDLHRHRRLITTDTEPDETTINVQSDAPPVPRTDLEISGIFPHLTTYGIYSQNGGHYKAGHNECGIGAIVPWAGRLWMVNYAPHQPRGSEHKLYSVGPDLTQPMMVHPESVGGTPAGRMIHRESNQLLIGHHLVDASGRVRTISPEQMPMRVTAIARHLVDPANFVYYVDMEGAIWEANVHTLSARRLYEKPVPGWHAKGGYSGQGRLVVSNNGEHAAGSYDPLLVGGPAKPNSEEAGVLAQWDGEKWEIIERRQFTEVTGPAGIAGGGDANDPIWAIGWDRRSLRLKLLDHGKWHTYLLPKAAHCNDAKHGWYTEWPRIRRITPEQKTVDGKRESVDRWMMDMHGMFFDFPRSFSKMNSAGIRPIASHLRYVPDFCDWNGRLVLASDETSIQGNRLAGQPQSNLWFGTYEDLKSWGPASGFGGPWIEDPVVADQPSDPFLVAGFDQRVIHLAVGQKRKPRARILRATDQQTITSIPDQLADLPRVTVERGNWKRPAPGFEFETDHPVTVYLAVDQRGQPKLPDEWELTELSLTWGKGFRDHVYRRDFAAGKISIPANQTEHTPGSFGMPHMAMVSSTDIDAANTTAVGNATVTYMPTAQRSQERPTDQAPVTFTLEVDRSGDDSWTELDKVRVPADGYVAHHLPSDLDAIWLRFRCDRDCVATALLHQTEIPDSAQHADDSPDLFGGLADLQDKDAIGGLLYAAKRNRNLRILGEDDRYFEFTKSQFEFRQDQPDEKLSSLLHVDPEFAVDEASVMIRHDGQTLRLPKGHPKFDRPFAFGQPRSSREVESERHLANLHGTFYEVPLITNGSPPAWNLMRPVSSHSKQIHDFCSWNGLLVLSGVRPDATRDGHVFRDDEDRAALWFGGVDDLWKLGKPVGRGGPWSNSDVVAGVPSDPYLMRGYDRKSVSLSHTSTASIEITLQVDLDGNGLWVDYRSFEVPPGETVSHEFTQGYSAYWVRAVSRQDTTATVSFLYH